jgi:diguanylate cyclase (GGDEF)-like protein/PAS domain S-box-containing protein
VSIETPGPGKGDHTKPLEGFTPSPRFFELIALMLLGSGLAYAAGVYFLVPDQTFRYIGPAASCAMALTSLVLLRTGRAGAAVKVLIVGSWCIVTLISIHIGGVRSTLVVAYPLLIILAGWLVSLRMALVLTRLTVAAIVAFVTADAFGMLPVKPAAPGFLYGVVQLLTLVVSMIVIAFLVHSYRGRVAELRDAGRQIIRRTEALEATRRELNRAQVVARTGSWVYHADRDSVRLSAETSRILGMNPDTPLSLLQFVDRAHPDDREGVERAWREAVEGGAMDHEHRVLVDQQVRWVRLKAEVEYDEGCAPVRVLGIVQDVTERKESELKLQLAASVFESAREGIMITATDGRIIDVNSAFSRITGYHRDEAIGRTPSILKSGRHDRAYYARMWAGLIEKGHWYGEIWNRRKNGEVFAEMQAISTVRDARGVPQQYVSLFSDITAQKEHEKQLERIAHFDALTSLPNRVLLADRMHQAMAHAERRGERLAVAYLDLDGFKAVNDTFGHEVGDQLLMALAARMKLVLREGDTLARLGGDEFVAVILDLGSVEDCSPTLSRLLAAAAQPLNFDDRQLQVSASLGVTFFPQAEAVDADQLLRQADQAMYQAKLAGKNRFHVFDADQDRSARGHHESLDHIRNALIGREFVLYYQPKVNMRTGAVVGAEALIRWQHPERGLLAPAVFLPVVDEHPLAVDIGEWVIDTALGQIEAWQDAGLDLPVSVNVAPRQLQETDFVERLQALLQLHPRVRPSALELEVLETSALEDLDRVSRVIGRCRELGIRFALDDFGTGYSSLTYLKHLHVSQLKIDRSFVRDMLEDPEDLAILEGVLGLASAFRREVIAEGVESREHGELLLELGCEFGQGFGIAKPMPAELLPAWVATWRPPASWMHRDPVRREDLPLLFACVEHRAWINALENYLRDDAVVAPALDPTQCRFGAWFAGEGRSRYGRLPAYRQIDPLHRRIHELGGELCRLKETGRAGEALRRLPAIRELRDELLARLGALTVRAD